MSASPTQRDGGAVPRGAAAPRVLACPRRAGPGPVGGRRWAPPAHPAGVGLPLPSVRVATVGDAALVAWADPERLIGALGPDAPQASWLDPQESARLARLADPRDRRAYLAAHLMRRAMLSAVVPRPPECWRFHAQRFGRPTPLRPPSEARFLAVSIAYRRGLAACAVATDGLLGVDVEGAWPSAPGPGFGDHLWAPQEAERLLALGAGARRATCARLWSLKEAYAKALGVGLRLPMQQLCFTLARGRGPSARLSVAGRRLPAWSFWQRPVADGFWLSVARLSGQRR